MKRLTSVQFRPSAETTDAVFDGYETDNAIGISEWGRAECSEAKQVMDRKASGRCERMTTSALLLPA